MELDDLEFDFERPDPETDIDEYLRVCVGINQNDLNAEFIRVASDLAFWTKRFAEAYEDMARKKADYERQRAYTWMSLKEGAVKRMTREDLEAAVLQDEDVSDAHVVYVVAESKRLKLRGVVDAIQTKKDMLQSLGAKLRAEMMSDPVLRERLAGQSVEGMTGL